MDKISRFKISAAHLIPISFMLVIFSGTILLMLPIATSRGNDTGVLTALFTATTSVCVTGLVVVDTYAHWSLFGQIVILLLVQIGGLGVVAVATMVMVLGRRKISFGERVLLKESLNFDSNRGLLHFLKRSFKGVFLIEGIGVVLCSIRFIPQLGLEKGIWASVFQSVSAFCNAGMDVIGPDSMMDPVCQDSVLVMFVTMGLIVMGGIGFVVWLEVFDGLKQALYYRYSPVRVLMRLSEHTKLVLVVTFAMILFGTLSVLAAEYHNPATLGHMELSRKIINSLFQSVTFRTAGFASVPQNELREVSCFIGCILMFIGGSPVGTAGGIKTVTAALFFMNALSYSTKQRDTVIFQRRVSTEMMRKASAIVFVSLVTLFVMTILLLSRGGIALTDALYEVTSALGTVGLSRNLTPRLDDIGRIIIITSMYLGRIGPISLAFFLSDTSGSGSKIRYSKGKFYVG